MKKESQSSFSVMGLQIRTTNAAEMKGEGKIGDLWSRFYSEQVASKISGKVSENIFAVYHDYESDMNGEYSLTVGFQVKPGMQIPDGLRIVQIPEQEYMKFTTDTGEMPGVVINTWQKIWTLSSAGKLNRKYSADFEVYDHRCANPANAQLDVFIAVKP